MYLTQSSELAEQPSNCDVTLWEHQLKMLHRCQEIEKTEKYGIISDQPGSGKTYVVLSLINNTIRMSVNFPKLTNVVVVTNNIFNQWLDSIKLFKNLSYYKFIDYQDISSLYYDSTILTKYDVLLTTPLYFNVIAQILKNQDLYVYRLIIDEIDNTSSLILNEFNCHMRWFVSGSFNNEMVGCYRKDLDTMIKENGNLDQITCCCDPSLYHYDVVLEEPITETIICKDIYIDFIMEGIISEDERCALNALDFSVLKPNYGCSEEDIPTTTTNFKDILKQLQENFMTEKSELEVKLTDLEVSKNRLLIIQDLEKFHYPGGNNPNHSNNNQTDRKLLLISKQRNDILTQHNLNNKKLDRMNDRLRDSKICTICFEALDDENHGIYTTECCQSLYCGKCIKHWLDILKKRSCPHCKSLISFYQDEDKTCLNQNVITWNDDSYHDRYRWNDSDISDSHSDTNSNSDSENDYDYQYRRKEEETKVYKVFQIIDGDDLKSATQNLKQLNLEIEQDQHQNNLDRLNQNYHNRKQELQQQEQREKQELEQRKLEFKKLELEAQIRFREIKERQDEYEKNTSNMSSKLDYLKQFLSQIDSRNDRIIIFSDYSSIFKEITQYLAFQNIGHVTLDGGNIQDLQNDIDDYLSGKRPILMANSSMYGYGMNLQHTTHIVLVHKLECCLKKEQLIARAQRPGRHTRLKIIQLWHKNEINKDTISENPTSNPVIKKKSSWIWTMA